MPEDVFVNEPLGDAPAGLSQYTHQLNIYGQSDTDSHRARIAVNYADQLELSYKTGLGSVLIKKLFYQDGDFDIPHDLAGTVYSLSSSIGQEVQRAGDEEKRIEGLLTAEVARAKVEEGKNAAAISAEASARQSAISSVQASVTTLSLSTDLALVTLSNNLANESSTRAAANTVITSNISANAAAIAAEETRASDEVATLSAAITLKDVAFTNLIQSNAATALAADDRAKAAEVALGVRVDGVVSAATAAATANTTAIANAVAAEASRATAAELALSGRIDNVLSNIDPAALDSFTEVVAALGDSGAGNLAGAINDEVAARTAAISALQLQLDEIKALLLALQQGN